MATITTTQLETFSDTLKRLRAEARKRLNESNFVRATLESRNKLVEGREVAERWYENGTPLGQYVRLVDIPGTLSHDILSLRRDLPIRDDHFAIEGDTIRTITNPPPPPPPLEDQLEDDSEDLSAELANLPLVQVDLSKHFLKKGKYRSEIYNLLKCQGGSCPGEPISPLIVRLLGKSSNNELVLERLIPMSYVFHSSLLLCKSWILDIISALKTLHSLNIVHRDLCTENLVWTKDAEHCVVCDLEGRWGRHDAPEIRWDGSLETGLDSGWTEKSDIYDLGWVIKGFVHANNPRTRQIEWPVPAPLDKIVEACMKKNPEERASLDELREMVEAIKVEEYE